MKKGIKSIISFFISLTMLLSLATVFPVITSASDSSGDWIYEANGDGTATITGFIGFSDTLEFPTLVKTLKVTRIAGSQYGTITKIKSVTIPEGVKELGASLFGGFTSLETVSLPSTLTTMGNSVFYKCSALKTITIPNNVAVIPTDAFAECLSLTSVSLGTYAKAIEDGAFRECKNIQSFTFSRNITTIGENAFRGCESLRILDIPSNVRTIGKYAFQDCSSLEKANIPNGVKTIEQNTFTNCTMLSSVTIPSTVTKISKEAFLNCYSLTSVSVPASVKYIEAYSFGNCTSLTEAIFGGDYMSMPEVFSGSRNAIVYYPKSKEVGWSEENFGLTFQPYTEVKSFSGSNLTLTIGDSKNLNIKCNPETADFKNKITYISDEPNVVSVTSDGKITAKTCGVANITVSSVNGISTTYKITVNPKPVTGVSAKSKSTNSIELSWKEASEVIGYNIYRSTSKTGTYKKVDTVVFGVKSFTDTGLKKGTTYYYKVESFSKSTLGEVVKVFSEIVTAKAVAPAPTTVSATKTAAGKATIKWSKSIGASGYEISYSTSKTGTYKTLATITSGNTLSYKATGLTKGKTYYIKIRTFTTVSGKKIYSDYSKIVNVKV